MARCPTCSAPVDLKTSQSGPFCSDRCRQIDLGRWLDERQVLPIYRDDEDEADEGASPTVDDE